MSASLVDLKQHNSRIQIQAFLAVAEKMGTAIAGIFAYKFLEMFPSELEFGAYLEQEEEDSLLYQKCVSCGTSIEPKMLGECLFLEEDGTPAFYQCFDCEDFSEEEYEDMYEGGIKDFVKETGMVEVEEDIAQVEFQMPCSLCKKVYLEVFDTSLNKTFKLPDICICNDCKNRN